MLSVREWSGRKPGFSYAASAAIIFLPKDGEPELLLAKQYPENVTQNDGSIFRTAPSWKLITGEMEEEDETPLHTALREYSEETGGEDYRKIRLEEFLPFFVTLPSRRSAGFHEKWFFLGIAAEKFLPKKDPHPEIELLEWFSITRLPLRGPTRVPRSHTEGLTRLLTINSQVLFPLGVFSRLIADVCAEITA